MNSYWLIKTNEDSSEFSAACHRPLPDDKNFTILQMIMILL